MPTLTYYLCRINELGLREALQQARSLAGMHVANAANRAYDNYIRRDVVEADVLKICGFATARECAEHFRNRAQPIFFIREDAQTGAEHFWKRFSQQAEALIEKAENIRHHQFDLLGSGLVDLNAATTRNVPSAYLPWHTDFKSGFSWGPRTYYKDVRYGDTPGVDVKVPWELSRFQHLLTLGQAYYLTRNESYAEEFVKQISDWIYQNPCRYGVNWACTMDVGIRAVNWVWAFYFFRKSRALGADFVLMFLTSLYRHVTFIRSNLEFRMASVDGARRRLNSNHYLSDIVGLLYIAVMFPEFQLKEHAKFAAKELETELFEETTADGVDYEHSTSYHRLVLELFLSAFVLLELNSLPMSPATRDRLTKMAGFVADYLRPDGSAPQIGDADDGRLHPLSIRTPGDHSYLPPAASKFLSCDSLRNTREDPEVWWWAGSLPRGPITPRGSKGYPEAGFYIMRSENAHVFVSAAEVGMHGLGSHSHNDLLSFEYWAAGRAWIVDPGTYLYTPDPDARNYFRSTAAHNTVRIDGVEINRFDPQQLFQIPSSARVRVRNWKMTNDRDTLEAEHTGYLRLDAGVTHARRYLFTKSSGSLVIDDSFEGTGVHALEWFFHAAPGIEISQGERAFSFVSGNKRLILSFGKDELAFELIDGWYSPSYGVRQHSLVLSARLETAVPASVRVSLEIEGA